MRLKNLERYQIGGTANKMQLAVPLPTTPDGRVYRYSPSETAYPRHFVLGNPKEGFSRPSNKTPRMKQAPGSPKTVCPYSGTVAEDAAFTHPDDIRAATETVKHAALADIADAFHGMFRNLARRHSSNSAIRIESGSKPRPRPKPRFGRRDLLRELVCDECGRDYGVFAISLFCPDCGAPNLHLHFAREVELVRQQVDTAEAQHSEREELAYRLLGNAHEDVLTAVEATLKAVYQHCVVNRPAGTPEVRPVRNDFQNIEKARARFAEFSFAPFAILSAEELSVLTLNIQKRHVIGHNLGVADAKFAEHATDARLGETIPLVGDDIRRFADVSQRVVNQLDEWLAGGEPPPRANLMDVPTTQSDVPPQRNLEESEVTIGELSPLAIRIARWISKMSPDGMTDLIEAEALAEAFKDVGLSDLALAIAELETDGYLTTVATMGSQLPHVKPTFDLFATLDPVVHNTDPIADAVALIEIVLTGEDSVGVADLHARTSWPLRRFNPAIALVIDKVDDGRVSKEMGGQYPSRYFFLMPADRVELKRFLTRLRG